MMKRLNNYVIIALLMIGIGGFITTVQAQKSKAGIRKLLEKRDQQIKELVGPEGTKYTPEQRQKLKDIINDVIDYKAMGKYALQDTYGTLSPEQQKEFIDLFSTIIRDHSLNNLDIYRSKVTYKSIDLNGDDAVVVTLAELKNVRTPVTYKMHYKEDAGKWVVTDLIIDDVSTADSYQRQFQNIIRKKSYDYLIKTLRKRAGK